MCIQVVCSWRHDSGRLLSKLRGPKLLITFAVNRVSVRQTFAIFVLENRNSKVWGWKYRIKAKWFGAKFLRNSLDQINQQGNETSRPNCGKKLEQLRPQQIDGVPLNLTLKTPKALKDSLLLSGTAEAPQKAITNCDLPCCGLATTIELAAKCSAKTVHSTVVLSNRALSVSALC